MEPSKVIQGCIVGMIPLVMITISGAILTYINAFSKASNDIISRSFPNYFFPIFCLFNLAKFVGVDTLSEIWPIFISPTITILVSCIIGVMYLPFIKPPRNLTFTTLTLIILPNMGNVPLLILKGTCSPFGVLGGENDCSKYTGYIAMLAFTFNIYMWVGGYVLIQLDSIREIKQREFNHAQQKNSIDFSVKELDRKPVPLKSIIMEAVVSPVPICSLIGFVLGLIPGVKWLFFYPDSPLIAVSDTAFSLAHAGLLFSQMVLGSNIVLCFNDMKSVSFRYAFHVVFIRNILIPTVAL